MNIPEIDSSLNIGVALRQMRTMRRLSLREMAKRAGVTASFISQIENGRANPSVETLFSLAQALEVPVTDFFATNDQPPEVTLEMTTRPGRRIVRREGRKRLKLDTGIVWESLTGEEQSNMRFVEIIYPPGGRSTKQMIQHTGRDFFVVLEGQINVRLEFQEHVLQQGDSMWFDATIPHQIRNESSAPARIIAVNVDPWLEDER